MQNNAISLVNENGQFKSREDFLNEMNELYTTLAESETVYNELSPLFSACTKLENQIDTDSALRTFNFIDKAIIIKDEITEDTSKLVIDQIRFWNAIDVEDENPDPIIVYIDSPGGSLNATLSIIAAIQISKTPVYTVNLGKAWSGGFFLLIAGTKRFALPYSSYLFHEGSSALGGDAHKVLQEADFYKYQLGLLKDITLDNTNIGENLYEKHRKDDWWFGNEIALKYNIIDGVMNDFLDFDSIIKEDN